MKTLRSQSNVSVLNVQSKYWLWAENLRAVFTNQFSCWAPLLCPVLMSVQGRCGAHIVDKTRWLYQGSCDPRWENIHKIKKRKNKTGFLIQSKHWSVIVCEDCQYFITTCHQASGSSNSSVLLSSHCYAKLFMFHWSHMYCRVITLHFLHKYDEESLAL